MIKIRVAMRSFGKFMNIINLSVLFLLLAILTSFNPCYAKNYDYLNSQDEKFVELFTKGYNLKNEEKFNEAAELFEKAYEINPKHMMVISELCACYYAVEDMKKLETFARKGLIIAQKYLDKDNIGRFYHYLAAFYHFQKNYEKSIKFFNLALYNKPYFTAEYPSLAYSYYKFGKYDEAIEYYKKANNYSMVKKVSEERDNSSPIYKHLTDGLLYEQKKDFISAEKEYLAVIDLDPDNIIGLVKTAGFMVLKNNYKEAIELGEKTLKLLNKKENEKYSHYYEFLYLNVLSKSYEELNDINKSTNYNYLFQIVKNSNDAYSAIDNKNYEQALTYLKEALGKEIDTKNVPYNYSAIEAIIKLLLNLGKYEEASEYIQKAIKICKSENNEDEINFFTSQVGNYYVHKKEYEKALKYFELAYNKEKDLTLKCKYKYASLFPCVLMNNKEKVTEILKECNKLIEEGAEDFCDIQSKIIEWQEKFDNNSDLNQYDKHFKKGYQLFLNKSFNEAIKELALALEYVPQKKEAMLILSECLFDTEQFQESSNLALEGFRLCQRNNDYTYFDDFCYLLGSYYYDKEKDYKEALNYFLHALKHNPKVDYFFYIGHCYLKLEDYDRANDLYKKCATLDPQNKAKYLEYQALCVKKQNE